MTTNHEHVDTLIIGAGQAGLATAYHLRELGRSALVVHADARVGDQWRARYASLRLNTPARYDGLPGMPFPAARSSFPTGRAMADYLTTYASRMGLAIRHRVRVTAVDRLDDGTYLVHTGSGLIRAQQVVIAAGSEHHPYTPDIAADLDPAIRQIHSSAYREPSQLLPGPVLVVGAGQSGADIALELVRAGHDTWLSGTPTRELPIDLEGRRARLAAPLLWFAANHILTVRTPIGRRVRPKVRSGGAPLLRVKLADLERAGVHHSPERTTGTVAGRPELADGTLLDVANIVWCTGFRPEYGYISPPVTADDGWPRDHGGIMPDTPGLYFVGLTFQRGFYSMLIGGAGRDARHIAEHIAAHRPRVPATTRTG
jgi:putative flavoprotein involved in K+ transport